ncbi:uncharacterized protein LOC118405037 [Branchiostoma floridae]|uniref:Uncharacterized protein LOC118405037 n=1 Tax=Branchiostoma floridae TaxID=7739 RepID=A0A9J7HL93_BRAFL|nr:uncharacterized protein LOC118405037 [Branchiostoma floridae]
MINKFKCVVTVAMGTSVFLFFGLANKQFWQLRSYKPFHAPAPLSRDLFSDGFGDKTIPDAREGARLHRILQEFTGSYLDIPADKETATSADFTEFQILHPGSVYRVGDILSVMILAKDMRNSYASLEWYCERPWNVTCNQSVYHGFAGFRSLEELGVTKEERLYFKPG